MAKALSVKATRVLQELRENGGRQTAQQIADNITAATPCSACNGTGDPAGDDTDRRGPWQSRRHDEMVCGKCYGRGTRRFDYSAAMTSLKQLHARGLAERLPLLDEWGDPVGGRIVWQAVADADPDDPLEQAFNLPAADR